MKKYIPFVLGLCTVIAINIYFRLFPAYFPQLKTQAKNIVQENLRRSVSQEIFQRFPQFDPHAKEELIKSRVEEYKKFAKEEIKKNTQEIYLQLKNKFQDDSGQTYLMELDCWHWARYVENVLTLGHPGDQEVHGAQLDLFMLAPLGSYLVWDNFLFYFSAFLYKAFSLFYRVPLFTFLFYLPLLFIGFFVAVLYFFGYRLKGAAAAIITALFVGLGSTFIPRSCAGWFDKDILSMCFPVLVIYCYALACDYAQQRKKLFWICASSFWVGIFCFTWTYWWFSCALIVLYECIYFVLAFARFMYVKKIDLPAIRQHALSLGSFLVFSFIWVVVFCRLEPIEDLYRQVMLAVSLNKPLMSSIWPNVFSTVGELKSSTFRDIFNLLGGQFIFFPSVLCLAVSLIVVLRDKKYSGFTRVSLSIFTIWFVVMFYASARGIRFVMFLLVPLGVALGFSISQAYEYLREKKGVIEQGILGLLAMALVITVIGRAYDTSKTIYPLIDDNWYKVLMVIKEKTPQETILNSWLDFGDWFKVVGKRRVIFDGQSQATPQAYWMGKVLMSDSEETAIAILRMLNNGGNKAYEIINEQIKEPLQSVLLLESVIGQAPEQTQQILSGFLPPPAVEQVMKLLFSAPSRACFIVESSMIFKSAAISYLGNWDFSKVYIAQNLNTKEKDVILDYLKKLGRNPQDIQRFYQEAFLISKEDLDDWLSQRRTFYTGVSNGTEKDGVVSFDNGFVYNIKDRTIGSGNDQIPRSLFVLIDNSQFTEMPYPNANVVFSVLVMHDEKGYRCILLDRELANSMFVRLYFFSGQGLKHFAPFINAEDGNNYIRVFNIIW